MAPKVSKTIVKAASKAAAVIKPTPKEKASASKATPQQRPGTSKPKAAAKKPVETVEVTDIEVKQNVDPGACSRMLSYLKYQGDAAKNKRGDSVQVKSAQNALQASCQQS